MKQTAIDWLVNQFLEQSIEITYENMYIKLPVKALQQAKQMEQEQMIEFAEDYIDYHCYADFDNQITYDKTATEYYNETYKGGNND